MHLLVKWESVIIRETVGDSDIRVKDYAKLLDWIVLTFNNETRTDYSWNILHFMKINCV